MIEFTKAFKASDGHAYFSIEDARQAEIECMMAGDDKFDLIKSPANQEHLAKWIVNNQEKIVDILTTTEASRPKARAIHGAKKTRKPKLPPTITASETGA